MLNRTVAGMLMAGLTLSFVQAEIIPNNFAREQQSRYEQVEMMDIMSQDSNYSEDPYYFQPINPESVNPKSIDLGSLSGNAMNPQQYHQPVWNKPNTLSDPTQLVEDCKQLAFMGDLCIVNNDATRKALSNQIQYLKKYPSYKRFADKGLNLSGKQLLSTANGLLRWLDSQEPSTDRFEVIQMSNHTDKAKFTGYYTPEMSARKVRTPLYRFPIYKKPTDLRRTMSRAEIDNGGLKNSGYEIAWVKDPVDLFYIHMQGSGVLIFNNGERKTLHFAGSNGFRFHSIARYMQQRGYLNGDLSRRAITAWFKQHPDTLGEVFAKNPRYVFFKLGDGMATTASGMNLVPGHTVAVDTSFIPFGAVLLAEVPRIDTHGTIVNYEWRLLFPQDRGNAIRGNARLDFYTGTGELAKHWANKVTGLRQAYLLLDKGQRAIHVAANTN